MMKMSRTTRVAVTGVAGGGKTVFLTSLLWHLAEFSGSDFSLPNELKLRGWREIPVSGSPRDHFPLDRYREMLARNAEWPEKTTASGRFVCEYDRSDWKFFRQRLSFLDFPGERVADAAIAAFPDYDKWSEHMLWHWDNHADYRAAAEPFLAVAAREDATEAELILEYKKALARLIIGFKPLVTPSVFLLDEEGMTAAKKDVDALAEERFSGLEGEEFCPLPETARARFPDFGRRFKRYRRQVVLPLFKELARSHALVALVDIPALLAGGVGRYNDNRQIMLDLIETMRPETTLGGKIMSMLKLKKSSLRRVAFVASQCDLVHPKDIENGNLQSLLRDMNARAKGLLHDMRIEWFTSTACRSTREGKEPYVLVGRLQHGEGGQTEFPVTPLPDQWPGDWQAGTYRYQRVMPETKRNLQNPPEHINLDRVFEFIAG